MRTSTDVLRSEMSDNMREIKETVKKTNENMTEMWSEALKTLGAENAENQDVFRTFYRAHVKSTDSLRREFAEGIQKMTELRDPLDDIAKCFHENHHEYHQNISELGTAAKQVFELTDPLKDIAKSYHDNTNELKEMREDIAKSRHDGTNELKEMRADLDAFSRAQVQLMQESVQETLCHEFSNNIGKMLEILFTNITETNGMVQMLASVDEMKISIKTLCDEMNHAGLQEMRNGFYRIQGDFHLLEKQLSACQRVLGAIEIESKNFTTIQEKGSGILNAFGEVEGLFQKEGFLDVLRSKESLRERFHDAVEEFESSLSFTSEELVQISSKANTAMEVLTGLEQNGKVVNEIQIASTAVAKDFGHLASFFDGITAEGYVEVLMELQASCKDHVDVNKAIIAKLQESCESVDGCRQHADSTLQTLSDTKYWQELSNKIVLEVVEKGSAEGIRTIMETYKEDFDELGAKASIAADRVQKFLDGADPMVQKVDEFANASTGIDGSLIKLEVSFASLQQDVLRLGQMARFGLGSGILTLIVVFIFGIAVATSESS